MSPDASRLPTPSPDELVTRCLDGDQAAWDAVVKLYWRRVFNVAYKFVGRHDQAEDLTQDIFLRVYKSLDTFDRRANFGSWLISVSRNLCIDHYRRVRRERETVNAEIDPATLAPVSREIAADARLDRRDRARLLRLALERVPPTLRGAVMLRDIHELSYQEIADRLQVPEGTIKSRINRGRTELARQIQALRDAQAAIMPPSAGADR